MRVIIFSAFYYPYKGGYVESVHELSVRLLKRGYKMFIVACGNNDYHGNFYGIEVYNLRCWNPDFLNNSFPIIYPTALFKLFKFLYKNRFSYVVTNTRFFPITWVGFIFGKLTGIPVIHIERGGQHSFTKSFFINLIARVVDHTIGFIIVRFSDVVIGVSDAACAFLSHLGAVKPVKIHNGIDVVPEFNVVYGSNLPLKVTFVGRLVYGKGLNELISAASMLDDVIVQIIGDGPYKKTVEKMVDQLDLGEKIVFLGALNHQEVMKVLLSSDIFINTSYSEGLPRCVLEAGSVGLPVIATDVGGTREIICDNDHGILIAPHNVDAIVGSIANLVKDSNLREKMGKNIKNRINTVFNWENIISKYEKECFSSHDIL